MSNRKIGKSDAELKSLCETWRKAYAAWIAEVDSGHGNMSGPIYRAAQDAEIAFYEAGGYAWSMRGAHKNSEVEND